MIDFLQAINIAFALIFAVLSWQSIRYGLPFLRLGWSAIAASRSNARTNDTSRQTFNNGRRLVVGGLFWLIAGLVAAGVSLYFLARGVG